MRGRRLPPLAGAWQISDMSESVANHPLIGHNSGPALCRTGTGWATHCWQEARRALLPHLPVEVVRLRVRRAAELGLDYRTYAGVRATSGRDLVAFLFSSNALGLHAGRMVVEPSASGKIAGLIDCGRLAVAQAPLRPHIVQAALPVLEAVGMAPGPFAEAAEVRRHLRETLGSHPAAAVLLVGDTAWEHDWCAAAGLAGYLPAPQFFRAGHL